MQRKPDDSPADFAFGDQFAKRGNISLAATAIEDAGRKRDLAALV